ncbi:MAG: hypothetical protein EA361_10665 [Bacteroidetes bacterium]|nr:MAG: hypothetical protein EA361_10665 [Bacteroidota bacterium]
MLTRNLFLVFALFSSFLLPAQGLLDLLEEEAASEGPEAEYVSTAFFSTRVINGQSVENPYPGDLIFIISHHFGSLNQGSYELFGIDNATIRMGFEYGVNDRLALSLGRSTWEKNFDGFFKYKLLRQQTGLREVPVTVSWFSGVYIKSERWAQPDRGYDFHHRMSYVHQVLVARKFSPGFSLQLTPAWVHKNLVPGADDPNDLFVLGAGGRMQLTPWVSFNAEYFYRFNPPQSFNTWNSFSIGFDFDTGGHVFQLHFTNSQPMFERAFLTETRGNWIDGDIYFGFNITRVFGLRKP